MTNRRLSAAEALDWGLVNQVVPDEAVLTHAEELAQRLANGPTRSYGAVKKLLTTSFNESLETQMEHESRAIAAASNTADGREGISAFLEKRTPAFEGR